MPRGKTCTVAAIRGWMHKERRGYKAAAEHFGKTEKQLRAICGSRAPAPEVDQGKDWSKEPPAEFWAHIIFEALEKADREKGVAATAALRTAMDARKHLEALGPSQDVKDPTQDERLASLRTWPDQWLEEAATELAQRTGARFLLVTNGGQTAELTEDGWTNG